MGRAQSVTVALAAAALLVGGLGSAAAQGGAEDAFNSRIDPQAKKGARRGAEARAAEPAVAVAAPAASEERARGATPATPATPASPGSPSAAAAPATPATPAVPPAQASGLSRDAPDTAPSVGVVGGGRGKGNGPSPAATPEPSTLLLMAAGLAGLHRLRRRRSDALR